MSVLETDPEEMVQVLDEDGGLFVDALLREEKRVAQARSASDC